MAATLLLFFVFFSGLIAAAWSFHTFLSVRRPILRVMLAVAFIVAGFLASVFWQLFVLKFI